MKNSLGTSVILTLFGESHGSEIGAVLDGLTPGIPVDEAFIDELYSHTISLKRLNLNGDASGQKADLGPLPKTSVILLCSLGAAWLAIGGYFLTGYIRKKKRKAG